MANNKKDVKQIVQKLMKQGWIVQMSGGGHYRLTPPSKEIPIQFISNTPSDRQAIRNIIRQLSRLGANL